MTQFTYAGSELDLFEKAIHWKGYWRKELSPYVNGDVLEVGAGIGANTLQFPRERFRHWTCLEPDPALCARLEDSLAGNPDLTVVGGTLAELPPQQTYDTILYIDVLEHIEDDAAEMRRAASHLRPDGHLLVLSPAHQWLFTPFDRAIGHFRRYSTVTLHSVGPPELTLVSLRYLDAVGMLASLGNRLLLRQSIPTAAQISLWDRYMVPISRLVDPLLGYRAGKSVIGVWRRDPGR